MEPSILLCLSTMLLDTPGFIHWICFSIIQSDQISPPDGGLTLHNSQVPLHWLWPQNPRGPPAAYLRENKDQTFTFSSECSQQAFVTSVMGITTVAADLTLKARKALLLAVAINLMAWSFIFLMSATNLQCFLPPGSLTKALFNRNLGRQIWLDS